MKLTTTERGLGHAHQQRVAQLPDPTGQPCPLCGAPMWPGKAPDRRGRLVSVLQADHTVARVLGGHDSPLRWVHRRCNASAGATLGNRLRGRQAGAWATPAPHVARREW